MVAAAMARSGGEPATANGDLAEARDEPTMNETTIGGGGDEVARGESRRGGARRLEDEVVVETHWR